MDVNDYIEAKLTHSLHTSERLSYRGCRRRWNWLFNDRWYPTTTAKPLEFGSAFHKAMETWYDPMFWSTDRDTRMLLSVLAFKDMCNEQKAAYIRVNDGQIDPEVEEDYNERLVLGEGMIRYHCSKVSPKLDTKFVPIRVEIEFEVPIVDPDTGEQLWCKCNNCWTLFAKWFIANKPSGYPAEWVEGVFLTIADTNSWNEDTYRKWKGLPVTYGGRIDCLVQDEFGRLWIVDWKTAARLSGQEEQDSPDEFIQLDDQITSYCWALWTLGIEVAGFIHHEMKKAFPIEPEPNKTQRKGCWYSVNKMQNTSYDLYLDTIKEGDLLGYESGAYDEFLEWLKTKGPHFYSRKQVVRSVAELRNAGRNIFLEASEMIDPGLRIYPSPGRFACTFCAFRQPCIGLNRDEDVEYLLISNFEHRERRYWEKNLPSTDSKGGQ